MSDLHPYAHDDAGEGRTAFLLPLLAAIVLLLVIGVGSVAMSGGDEVDPLEQLSAAPQALRDEGSARMAMTYEVDAGGMSMSFGADGVVDFVSGAGTMAMDLLGQTMELRFTDDTAWVRMPQEMQLPGVDGRWLEMRFDEIAGGALNQQMPGLGAAGYFDALAGVNDDIEDLGTEEVNGVDTEHYRFTVDVTEALDELPADRRAELDAAFASVRSDLDAVPFETWLSDDGVPVRQAFTIDVTEAGMTGTMRMQLDLSDFGVDVDVEPPPAEDVIDFDQYPELEQLIGAGSGASS